MRIRNVKASPEFIAGIMVQDCEHEFKIIKGIPENHTVIGAGFSLEHHCFIITIESPDFEDLKPDGCLVPFIECTIQKL